MYERYSKRPSRRCINDTTPDDVGPVRSPGINGYGWECRSLPQEAVRPCGPCLRDTGTSDLLHAGTLPEARSLRNTHGMCTEGQALQLQAADVLSQEGPLCDARADLRSRPGLLLLRGAGWLSHRKPPGFGTTLIPCTMTSAIA